MPPAAKPIAERFWTKVCRDPDTACWEWTASVTPDGYGKLGRTGAGNGWMRAHRFAYEHLVGPIPEGFDVDHLCRSPRCCNPAHLEAVSHRVNMLRSNAPMGIAARRTHCVNGHPLSGENLGVGRRGDGRTMRKCKACDRDRHRVGYVAKGAA